MLRLRPKIVNEDTPDDVPAWMLTFSDCMTLLLTFFVLLLSFSSFDETSLKQLFGALKCRPQPSILNHPQTVDDTLVREKPPVVDRTDKGAEKIASEKLDIVKNPRETEPIVETDAYHNERIFYIPTGRLFWGNGSALTHKGQKYLGKIALFMRLVPCKVIIGQMNSNRSKPAEANADNADNGLIRSCAIVRFLTHRQGLPVRWFCIRPTRPSPPQRFRSESVMQVRLLAKDLTQ